MTEKMCPECGGKMIPWGVVVVGRPRSENYHGIYCPKCGHEEKVKS